jgi:hypothetical protein
MRAPAYLNELFAEYEALVTKDPRHLTADENRSLAYYRADLLLVQTTDPDKERRDRVTAWVRTAHSVDRYLAEHGQVPRRNGRRPDKTQTAETQHLAIWLEDQRRTSARGRQCEYQKRRMAAYPNLDARTRDERWKRVLADYRAFLEEHHRAPSARAADPAEHSLSLWGTRQRRLYRSGTLAAERSTELASLPIWAWGYRRPR